MLRGDMEHWVCRRIPQTRIIVIALQHPNWLADRPVGQAKARYSFI